LLILSLLLMFLTACSNYLTPFFEKEKLETKLLPSDENHYFDWNIWSVGRIDGTTRRGEQQFELEIPEDCIIVGPDAFADLENLRSITFLGADTLLSPGLFRNCTNLVSVKLPSNCSEIPESCFEGCISLREIIIPSSARKICIRAFRGCISLQRIHFNTGITSIEDFAFEDCDSLREIVFPESLQILGSAVIASCDSMELVYIPRNLACANNDCIDPGRNIMVFVKKDSFFDKHILNSLVNFERIYTAYY